MTTEDVLARWVGAHLVADGLATEGPFICELLGAPPSGNSNVTLPFVVRWRSEDASDASVELVLRMQHPDNQIFFDADVLREFQVLETLSREATVPAPRPRWAERDPSILGHPFFVMDRVAGSVPAGMPSIHVTGWLSERTPAERAAAWESAVQAMVAVHRFDWRTHLPALADEANGTTIGERLHHLTQWYRWAADGRSFPVTDAGLDHLRSTVHDLTPSEPVLLWGDARMGNLMFGADSRVAAILDWELASIGPGEVDLAWWLTFEEFSTAAHGIAPLPQYPDRSATIARYTELSGRAPLDLEWYEAFAEWVITVTVIRMTDIAVAAGRLSPDTRMGHGNLTAQMLARRLGTEIPDLDPDYARRRNLSIHPTD